MTNRELARWCAMGNGEWTWDDKGDQQTSSVYNYYTSYDDEPCDKHILIRGWDETEWHKPFTNEDEHIEDLCQQI